MDGDYVVIASHGTCGTNGFIAFTVTRLPEMQMIKTPSDMRRDAARVLACDLAHQAGVLAWDLSTQTPEHIRSERYEPKASLA